MTIDIYLTLAPVLHIQEGIAYPLEVEIATIIARALEHHLSERIALCGIKCLLGSYIAIRNGKDIPAFEVPDKLVTILIG